jgi:hypothetical protein
VPDDGDQSDQQERAGRQRALAQHDLDRVRELEQDDPQQHPVEDCHHSLREIAGRDRDDVTEQHDEHPARGEDERARGDHVDGAFRGAQG